MKNAISDSNKEPSIKSVIAAASFIICHSKAWKQNSPDKAFWVYPDQVSKTPQTGEYLPTGSFIIRGKKNYINTTLQLGFGILFKSKGEMELKNIVSDNKNNNIEWAIPIVAPYSSVRDLKYKVKLIPGNGKKGKTFKMILNFFLKKKANNLIEKTFIKKMDIGTATDILVNGLSCITK